MHHAPLFQEKYRIPSARLAAYDYRSSGFYFVTWKVKGNARVLGHIKNGHVHLSFLGKIATSEIYETMVVRPGIYIDEMVVMPDHVHVLFEFVRDVSMDSETAQRAVSTKMPRVLHSNSLGSIVGQIKSKITKRIRCISSLFFWQDRFHDHIVRSCEIERIRRYIRNNPRHHTI